MGPNLFNTGYPSHGVVGIPSGVTRARERGCKACDGVRSAHWRAFPKWEAKSNSGRAVATLLSVSREVPTLPPLSPIGTMDPR
jgi:hypothetical protein